MYKCEMCGNHMTKKFGKCGDCNFSLILVTVVILAGSLGIGLFLGNIIVYFVSKLIF